MTASNALANVRIVLVEPTHPGNVGAVARAMRTMGLGDLRLVRPRRFPSAEATERAAGAFDVLDRARVLLWLVTGADKADVLRRLHEGDPGIPAGRVSRERAVVFADRAAAASLPGASKP